MPCPWVSTIRNKNLLSIDDDDHHDTYDDDDNDDNEDNDQKMPF